STEPVILSAAKDLQPPRGRSFAALRMTGEEVLEGGNERLWGRSLRSLWFLRWKLSRRDYASATSTPICRRRVSISPSTSEPVMILSTTVREATVVSMTL